MERIVYFIKKNLLSVVLLSSLIIVPSFSYHVRGQEISVDVDSYGQEFLGTGASCGLYIGHYLSMTEANQLKASEMLYKDLKMTYIKNYDKDYPWANPDYYDKITVAIKNAKKYNPAVEVTICVNNLPDHLEEGGLTDANKKGEHDNSIPGIMDSVANYYFHVCKGYYDREVTVDILELVNERGYDDGKVTDLYDKAATKFKEMINDPLINTTGVPMPKIAGPATWSAASPPKFINGWKAGRPNAWANVDIVTSHGYEKGCEENYQSTFDVAEGKLFIQSEQTGKLQTGEPAGVDVIAEQFPAGYPRFVTKAGIARHMMDFFNGGGNAFFCFLTNTHKYPHNAGLLATKWNGEPLENPIYYGFKHLSATHPIGSKKVKRDLVAFGENTAVAFRKEGENFVYVHFTNLFDTYEQVSIDFKTYGIKSVQVWSTDEQYDFEEVLNESYSSSVDKFVHIASPYSVHTLKVEIDPAGYTASTKQVQTLTFNAIDDKKTSDADFTLSASTTSDLDVQYTLLEGPAEISGNNIHLTGIGEVIIKAAQAGNEDYYEAAPKIQRFYVWPKDGTENVALNGSATVSSNKADYPGENAVDGDKTSNSSRWLNKNNEEYPHWIEVDFGEEKKIEAFAFWIGYTEYKKPVNTFDFEVWDGTDWKVVLSEPFTNNPVYLNAFPEETTSKIRLMMHDGDETIRMFELEVYEKLATTSSPSLNNLNTDIEVYPNPVTEMLHIKGLEKAEKVNIINLSGKSVYRGMVFDKINVSGFKEGLYFIEFESGKAKKFYKR